MPGKSRRKSGTNRSAPPAKPLRIDWINVATVWALGLYFVRFFVPAESAHLGETLWIVQIWLLLATFVCFLKWRFGEPFRFDLRDVAVWILVSGHVVAALVVICTEGQKRAATNMLWEWVGIGVAFSMLKSSAGHPGGLQRLLVGLVIILVVLSGFGLWQHYFWYPQQRELLLEFEHTTSGTLRHSELAEQLGPLVSTNDPTAAYGIRQRLMASTEPIGRFALGNTLAGLLASGLVLLSGALANALRWKRQTWSAACLASAILLVGYCLLLTKSRTAWIGLLMGVIVWAAMAYGRRLLRWQSAVIGGSLLAIVVVLSAVIASVGGLDRQVVTEAPKAMSYRFEFWTGTLGVIREAPLLGVGPGNFRQHYFRHKLPESSEEILDPHNLVLDVWASGGLLALAGLLGVLGCGFRGAGRTMRRVESSESGASVGEFPSVSRKSANDLMLVGGGLVAGVLLLSPDLLLGFGINWQLVMLAISIAIVGLMFRWAGTEFRFGTATVYGAASALLVHLLGQGGIAMPVTCLTLLLLLLSAPIGNSGDWTPGQIVRPALFGGLATATAAVTMIVCGVTATNPVLSAGAYMNVGRYEAANGNFRAAENQFQLATEADSLDPEPWQALAELEFHDWRRDRTPADAGFQRSIEYYHEAMSRNPHHPKLFWTLGKCETERFRHTRDAEAAEQAVHWLTRAHEGYPHSSRIQADYAVALAEAGQSQAARNAAARALELDALNHQLGHHDKVLDDGTRELLEAL